MINRLAEETARDPNENPISAHARRVDPAGYTWSQDTWAGPKVPAIRLPAPPRALVPDAKTANSPAYLHAWLHLQPVLSFGMTIQELKAEIRSLPKEQKRELTSDLIEEISAEDFSVSDEMLDDVQRRLADYRRDSSQVTTLAEIEARIRQRRA